VRRVVWLAVAALALIGGAVTPSGATAATSRPVESAPLNSSFEQSGDTWLVVPMGNLSNFLNTFWQLLVRSPTGSGWVTVTPPGVADNGGLAVTGVDNAVVAGFMPSQDLTFSPLGSTDDAGASWHGAYFPEALSDVPDALATGANGVGLALGRRDGGTVLWASGAGSWRTLTTLSKLDQARAGARCRMARMTAVAVAPDGDELVGGSCVRAGGSAVFALSGGSVQPIAVRAPGARVSVLRLLSVPGRVVGLFAIAHGRRTDLVAGWLADGARSFSLSAPLALPSDERLVATGSTAEGGVFVLLGRGPQDGRELAEVDPGSTTPSWDVLPGPPGGTLGAAFSNGRIDAVTVNGSTLIDYTLDQGDQTWVQSQRLHVPIQYGSSD